MTAMLVVLAAALPLAAPVPAPVARPTAVDATRTALSEAFAASLVDVLCRIGKPVENAAKGLRAERPDLPAATVAEFEQRLAAAAPQLQGACEQRARELVGAGDGPATFYAGRIGEALARDLAPRELEQLRAFLDSPAGRHAEGVRRLVDVEAYIRSVPWGQHAALGLYDELGMMLRAEVGRPPPKAGAAADTKDPGLPPAGSLPRAKLRNGSTLGSGCGSFYPTSSRRLGEEGSVVLQVLVGNDGKLQGVTVESSSGFPALDVAAAACVGAFAEFEPVRVDGQPRAAWQRMKWTWRLTE
jgi:TonB family protein